jgi:lysophospholipase L1-like esterase
MSQPVASPASLSEPPAGPRLSLGPDETIVVIGDSITEQHLYTALLECVLITRLPRAKLRFVNCGWGGDTAPGGAARFERDVAPLQPTLVLVNFGMNDGTYAPPNAEIAERWMAGIQALVGRIHACGARPALLTTSAVDEAAAPFLARYNETLASFAVRLRAYAAQQGIPLLDCFPTCLAALAGARARQPPLRLVPDGVHPEAAGQLVMAHAALLGIELPPGLGRLVCSRAGMQGEDRAATLVGEVAIGADRVAAELRLPQLPAWIPPEARPALALVPFQERHNPFTLDCSAWGMDACLSLLVDGVEIAVLAPGEPRIVDLALCDLAPWAVQGRELWSQVQARYRLHRLAWRELALTDPPAVQALPTHARLLAAIDAHLRASAAVLASLVAPRSYRLEVLASQEIGFTSVAVSPSYPCAVDRPGDFERRHPPETAPESVAWRSARLERWHLDLLRHQGGGANCVCYVRLRLSAAAPARVQWTLGSDDGISVIVNGARALEHNVYRACRLGDDQVETSLPAGVSTILLRVTQGGGGWSVAVRARALDGGPIMPLD